MNAIELQTRLQTDAASAEAHGVPVAPAADIAYRNKAAAAAEKFEGFFIGQMLRQMRASTREIAGEDSVFKNSVNTDMLDMADTMLADKMAGQRAFGIADAILRQLLPAAPAAPAAPSTPAAAVAGQVLHAKK
ncbi:flagellar biosynthesis protein FlgJ [Noviherbaspirillum cavernae]|uniref:Flagellar biosynthesis protein FlgJ n=1 Tax=Noviherbaspirillum cavernae TaxID=2320862 RepID=A0A418WVG1_9BURK|nr:rod-binding protein [Noviherbaspirillum cavernae]RJF96686.1 flagellar biosynthesis protein FlgJ [Noviherbaspirillum cavernae]